MDLAPKPNKKPGRRPIPFEALVSTTIGPCPRMFIGKSDTGKGYGKFRRELAHRYAYRQNHEDFDPTLDVLHTCDIRRCITDEHLFQGTNADNVADRVAKGRSFKHYGYAPHFNAVLRGEHQPNAKLTNEQADEIRRLRQQKVTIARLATLYGISDRCVKDVIYNISYKPEYR
jgi:hypothetical protein